MYKINPIPTGTGQNQPLYDYHVTSACRNWVKANSIQGPLQFDQIARVNLVYTRSPGSPAFQDSYGPHVPLD